MTQFCGVAGWGCSTSLHRSHEGFSAPGRVGYGRRFLCLLLANREFDRLRAFLGIVHAVFNCFFSWQLLGEKQPAGIQLACLSVVQWATLTGELPVCQPLLKNVESCVICVTLVIISAEQCRMVQVSALSYTPE